MNATTFRPTERPPRRMPSLVKIAQYNQLGEYAQCVKCGYSEGGGWRTANSWLERAHVIDRCFDGLDLEANLRPLCSLCHRWQPIFKSGDEAAALTWFARPLAEDVGERLAARLLAERLTIDELLPASRAEAA